MVDVIRTYNVTRVVSGGLKIKGHLMKVSHSLFPFFRKERSRFEFVV